MTNEEKILELLEKLESGQAALEGRLERIGADQKITNVELRNLEAKQAAFEGRMGRFETALSELQTGVSGLKVGQAQMQDDITGVKLRLELDVEKRFDAVNEGIDAILEKLTPKNRVDELEADVIVLKTAIRALTQEIAELKKAQ